MTVTEIPQVPEETSLRDRAVAYASAGMYIGPLFVGKHPGYLLGEGWPDKTSNDPEVVAGWFDGEGREEWNPYRANLEINGIFLHCGRSGLVVLDIDTMSKLPEVVVASIKRIQPGVQITRSDRSKFHAIYRMPEGKEYGNSGGGLGSEWGEVRGKNGIIVLEGTPHPKAAEGGEYKIAQWNIPELPPELAEELDKRPAPKQVGGERIWNDIGITIPHGTRDETMWKYACRLRAHNVSRSEAEILIEARLRDCQNPPGAPVATIEWALEKLTRAWHYEPGIAEAEIAEADFWKARPIFEHIHQYARAQQVPPMATLACVLARVVVAITPNVRIPPIRTSTASLNMLIALVGEPGGGKGSSERCSRDCFIIHNWLDAEDDEEGSLEAPALPLGSGEGIAKAFMRMVPGTRAGVGPGGDPIPAIPAHREQYRSRVMLIANEIETLGAIKGRGNSTLSLTLRSAFSGEVLGAQNAHDETTNIVQEHCYRLALIVGVQPDAASILLDEENVGTPQRFLWVSAVDPDAPDTPPEAPEPVIWEPPEYGQAGVDGGIDWGGPINARHMQTSACQEAVDNIRRVGLAAVRGQSKSSEGHIMLLRLKVATALAILDRRWHVNEEDWNLADVLIQHSERVKRSLHNRMFAAKAKENEQRGLARGKQEVLIQQTVSNANVSRVAARLQAILAEEWMSFSDARRRVRAADRQYVEEAIDVLVQRREIESEAYEVRPNVEGIRLRIRR